MEGLKQRRDEIAAFVSNHGEVTFSQLKEAFPHVSEMTLRTDLKALDQDKRIVRIHGGAKSLSQVAGNEDFFNDRFVRHVEEKKQIAQKAISLVQPDQTIYMDSGSTTTMLVQNLPDDHYIFFTTGLTCALEMTKLHKAEAMMIGGKINDHSACVYGSQCTTTIEDIHFDVAILSATNYSNDAFTCESYEDSIIKKTIIKQSKKIILLMDSSKINKTGTYRFCTTRDIDILVSDDNLPKEIIEQASKHNVVVF